MTEQGNSTASAAKADDFGWFADMVSIALMPTAFDPGDVTRFHAEGAVLDLEVAQVSKFSYSPLRSRRTPALIRKGDPEQYQLGLVSRGSAWFAQHGGESELGVGEMTLWDTSRPYESGSGTDGRDVEVVVLQIPKARMPLPSQQVDRLLVRHLPAKEGMGAILARFLAAVADNAHDCRSEELSGLGSMAVELATACLTQQLGSTRDVPAQVRSQALLRRIDAFIEHNLGDPALSPRVVAEHHHISLRGLYTLFDGRHEGVAASIRRRRLEHCRSDLARPELRRHSIQSIAARWGFTSPTVFSRSFRAAYGTTPHEYRADVLSPADPRDDGMTPSSTPGSVGAGSGAPGALID